MSGPAKPSAEATQRRQDRAWLQLVAAFGCVALLMAQFFAGLAALAVMAALWPPVVPYRPLRAPSVVVTYLPLALLWLVFATLYLHGADWLGAPVEPQAMLVQMARDGVAMEGFAIALFGVVVVAPFFEELVFRGYLFSALERVLPMWATQLVVAILFGLVHGWSHALPIGVLSLIFGYLRMRHRSLLPSMLAHALHNGITVGLMVAFPRLLDLFYAR